MAKAVPSPTMRMGGGLLTKIANNEIKHLKIDFLYGRQVKLMANVLKNNSSLKQVVMSWVCDESRNFTKQRQVVFGSRAVCMCEHGHQEELNPYPRSDVEGSEESLRD